LGAAADDAAVADLYRWTDAQGGVHYSNVREAVPAGVQVERLPDAVPPDAEGPPAAAAGVAGGTGAAVPADVAPASLDVERFELQRRYREATDRLAAIGKQQKALATAIEGAPEGGEDAVGTMEGRDAKLLAFERDRDTVTKQIEELRTRYADLRRRAAAANRGTLPVDWEWDLR
jgi:hypothetical protein